jgi:hypothetical protein
VTLTFAIAGGIVVLAALAGLAWGVPGQMEPGEAGSDASDSGRS